MKPVEGPDDRSSSWAVGARNRVQRSGAVSVRLARAARGLEETQR